MSNHFNTDPEQLIGAAKAATFFGVRPSTMQRWGRTGRIPTITYPNGRRLFSLDWCKWYVSTKKPLEDEDESGQPPWIGISDQSG